MWLGDWKGEMFFHKMPFALWISSSSISSSIFTKYIYVTWNWKHYVQEREGEVEWKGGVGGEGRAGGRGKRKIINTSTSTCPRIT